MSEFVKRVLQRARPDVREYTFHNWPQAGKVTQEAVGLLPAPGVDPERFLARVMDLDRYVGNVEHVTECRTIKDPAHVAPRSIRFYQRVKIPLLGEVQHEIVMRRLEAQGGFEVVAWELLPRETEALSTKVGIRSHYSDGAWLAAPSGVVGYALSTAPRRDDVGMIKWKLLTSGAELAASKMFRENIEGMVRWAARG